MKKKKKLIKVKDVMKQKFDIVDGMMTVENALKTMRHGENKALIVNKRDEHDEYGVLLISDIARQVLAKNKNPNRVNTYEIMAKPVVTVDPDMDIRYCARLFDRFGLSRCPVVKNGEVLGIVSLTDMVLKGLTELIDD